MIHLPESSVRAVALIGVLTASLVLPSCDLASAGTTLILNANSAEPPVVRHRFEYAEGDVTDGGQVEVPSMIDSDDLGEILTTNGVRRNQIVSARVDSVRVRRVSAPALTAAELYLGSDADGPRIATVQFAAGSMSEVDRSTRDVTEAVKQGQDRVFARFSVDDPDTIPPGGSVVRATVYYRIKAE